MATTTQVCTAGGVIGGTPHVRCRPAPRHVMKSTGRAPSASALRGFFLRCRPQPDGVRPQDPFADMRPHHDHKNWITEWIRSKMVTPEDREKKLAAVLGKMKNGADELYALLQPPSPPPLSTALSDSPCPAGRPPGLVHIRGRAGGERTPTRPCWGGGALLALGVPGRASLCSALVSARECEELGASRCAEMMLFASGHRLGVGQERAWCP